MSEQLARALLRLTGIVTAFVGIILAAYHLIRSVTSWRMVEQVQQAAPSAWDKMGAHFDTWVAQAVGLEAVADLSVVLLGIALFRLSPKLARLVTNEPAA